MKNTELQSLGHAAGMFQRSPKLIAVGLKLAAAERSAITGEPMQEQAAELILNGVPYYPAADIVDAITALARHDAEQLKEASSDE